MAKAKVTVKTALQKKDGTFKVFFEKGKTATGKAVVVAADDKTSLAAAKENLGAPTATASIQNGVLRLSGMKASRCFIL